MDEQQYYKKVYSKFWVGQTHIYGYGKYEQSIVRQILKVSPQRVFEVGIGTGWPIGASLKRKGIHVDGCDIADSLVVLARKELDNESGIYVGDIMEYKGKSVYDVTYCVRSSWYIPNFYATVEKMLSMTKPGGFVVFDIMDQNSLYCLKLRCLEMKEQYYRFLGLNVDERFGKHFVSVGKMKKFLKNHGLAYRCIKEKKIVKSKNAFNTPKVVFVCKKEWK
ncbi:MAG: class I SAM-dependent methyltransferase [Lachnospiraceae bacterium]|nr:class I SAM-dependent methyltransferase [Lachnospiraceae bacterium]